MATVGSAFKSFAQDLPSIRKEVVAALAAAATVVGVLQDVAPHSSVAGWAALAAGITALSAFLSSPQVVQLVSDVAGSVKAKSIRRLRQWRK